MTKPAAKKKPKPKKPDQIVLVAFRMTVRARERLKEKAKDSGTSIQGMLERFVTETLGD